MSAKMKRIADIIDLAINEHLWDGCNHYDGMPYTIFSCYAIKVAAESGTTDVMTFLQSMGLDPISALEFSSVQTGPKRQYARALWLTWAAMIAREEGITL